MEAVIFIGLQGSGKSTFFKEKFSDSHVRINLDMLRTRNREQILLSACIEAKQPFVVDNTNPTVEDRVRYVSAARDGGFRVVGYYFASKIEECKARNSQRGEDKAVPTKGLLGTYAKLEIPKLSEGFDELHYVSINSDNNFEVSKWSDEV